MKKMTTLTQALDQMKMTFSDNKELEIASYIKGKRGSKMKHLLRMMSLALLSATLFVSQSWADHSITVEVIRASHGDSPLLSQNLKKVEKRLTATFKTFNRFQSVDSKRFSLTSRAEHIFHIADGLDVKLKLLNRRKRDIDLLVQIPQRSVKHTVKAKLGRLFFEAIKWRGEVYLLAIRPL